MPDFKFELPENKADAVKPLSDSTSAKLQREYELLRDGVGSGVMHRLSSPSDLLLGAGAAMGGGAALRMMLDAGGRWGQAAKVIGAGFVLVGAADLVRRGIPTAEAMADTWKSGRNLDLNKNIVANNLGTALVDYPLMALSGSAGFKMAGRPTALSLDLANPKWKTDYNLNTSQKFNWGEKGSGPWNEAALANVNTRQLIGKLSSVDGVGLKVDFAPGKFMDAKGMRAHYDPVLREIKIPAKLEPAVLYRNHLHDFKFTDIRATSRVTVFPVLPVDLMDELELVQIAKIPQLNEQLIRKFQPLKHEK